MPPQAPRLSPTAFCRSSLHDDTIKRYTFGHLALVAGEKCMPPSVKQYLWRVANVAIGSTTLRNQGAAGVNRAARDFLANLALPDLVRDVEDQFLAELERQTIAFQLSLPPGAQHWGTARKGLNVFLGEVYYHRVLCEEYGITRIAEFLEVPLDSEVTRFLKNRAAAVGKKLPRWTTIKSLSPEDSKQYQEFAREHAKTYGEGWLRLHIDLVAWRTQQGNGVAEQSAAPDRGRLDGFSGCGGNPGRPGR